MRIITSTLNITLYVPTCASVVPSILHRAEMNQVSVQSIIGAMQSV
jgi:hypothetical protein